MRLGKTLEHYATFDYHWVPHQVKRGDLVLIHDMVSTLFKIDKMNTLEPKCFWLILKSWELLYATHLACEFINRECLPTSFSRIYSTGLQP